MALYRGMDVGTAKLTPASAAGVPHHLLDVLDVTETASVAAYQRAARARRRGAAGRRAARPVLVGGSGLYVQAVVDELEFPGTDPALRAELEAELADVGPAALHARLAAVDPAAAAAVLPEQRPPDRAGAGGRRADRAPVPRSAGRRRAAALRRRAARGGPPDRRARRARGPPGRADVRRRAGRRDPHAAARGLREGRTASRALGYQQVVAALDGAPEDLARRRPRPCAPPAGSSAGSAPGSAATGGSLARAAARTCSSGRCVRLR